jgi:hypothetical protein
MPVSNPNSSLIGALDMEVTRLTDLLLAAALPVSGVSMLDPEQIPDPSWIVVTDALGNNYRIDWEVVPTQNQINLATSIALAFDPRPRKLRLLYSIYQDIGALTAQQKTNIANNLFAGTPPLFTQDKGEKAADLLVLWTLIQTGGLSNSNKNLVRQSAAAIYVLDNVNYLVHPSFDSSINVPGDELA